MSRKTYHHGSLREALLDSALTILREHPADAVGLREVARNTGVSTAAPYRHFESREALLAALAKRGFRELQSRLQSVIDECGPGALAELGREYVTFALENRNLFDLMLRGERAGLPSQELRATSQAVFDLLQGAVDEVVGKPSRHGAIGAWALVHGLSVLAAERQLSADLLVPEALTALVANITEAYVSGLKTISSKDAEQAN